MTRYACILVTDGALRPEVFSFPSEDLLEAFIEGAEDPGEDFYRTTTAYRLHADLDKFCRDFPHLVRQAATLLSSQSPLND